MSLTKCPICSRSDRLNRGFYWGTRIWVCFNHDRPLVFATTPEIDVALAILPRTRTPLLWEGSYWRGFLLYWFGRRTKENTVSK